MDLERCENPCQMPTERLQPLGLACLPAYMKRKRSDCEQQGQQLRWYKQDSRYASKLQELLDCAGSPVLYGERARKLFPVREWALEVKSQCYTTSDLSVSQDAITRLRQETGSEDLVAHPLDWLWDPETSKFQWLNSSKSTTVTYLLSSDQFASIYGIETLDTSFAVADADASPEKAGHKRRRVGSASAAVPAEKKPWSALKPVTDLPAILTSEQDRKVYQAVARMVEDVRQGWEPSTPEWMAAQGMYTRVLESAERLRELGFLCLGDVEMLNDCLEQAVNDQQAVAVLSDMKTPSSRKKQLQQPVCVVDPQRLSRKLFGKLATLRREAKAHGYELVKIPSRLQACATCKKQRLIDGRASERRRGLFTCGDELQINQDIACGQEEEELSPDQQQPLHKGFVYIWEEKRVASYVRA